MQHPMRVGVSFTQQVHPIAVQREVWELADQGGFDHLWAFDHLQAIIVAPTEPVLDGWTVLGAMAERTTRIRIGLMVTGNLYRHPGLLAKIAVTVDHLSKGRLEMGMGAAWNEPEFRAMDLPFPSAAERVRRLDEACTVLKKLWTDPLATFDGRYYRLAAAIAEPKPLQKPHPPIWIGGSGPKLTLRVVAKHADAWNTFGRDPDAALAFSRTLDAHCMAIGRDPSTIRRSVSLRYTTPDEVCRAAERHVRDGFRDVLLGGWGGSPAKQVEEAARLVVPRVKEMS